MTKKQWLFVKLGLQKEKNVEEGECVCEESQKIYGGKRMRDARLKAGIGTQKELADRTGIAPNIISDLERGQRLMSPSWSERIGEAIKNYSIDLG